MSLLVTKQQLSGVVRLLGEGVGSFVSFINLSILLEVGMVLLILGRLH